MVATAAKIVVSMTVDSPAPLTYKLFLKPALDLPHFCATYLPEILLRPPTLDDIR